MNYVYFIEVYQVIINTKNNHRVTHSSIFRAYLDEEKAKAKMEDIKNDVHQHNQERGFAFASDTDLEDCGGRELRVIVFENRLSELISYKNYTLKKIELK